MNQKENIIEEATFAAGCFWGVEAVFRKFIGYGVIDTRAGYTGGAVNNPEYTDVLTGETGHAEAVEIVFDPRKISYAVLLGIFWRIHDPTQTNGQAHDIGTQYRSAIFYHSEEQRILAVSSKKEREQSGQYQKPLTTEIVQAGEFFAGEKYHQQYLDKNPNGYCHIDLETIDPEEIMKQ